MCLSCISLEQDSVPVQSGVVVRFSTPHDHITIAVDRLRYKRPPECDVKDGLVLSKSGSDGTTRIIAPVSDEANVA